MQKVPRILVIVGGGGAENLVKFLLGLNDLGVHMFSMPEFSACILVVAKDDVANVLSINLLHFSSRKKYTSTVGCRLSQSKKYVTTQHCYFLCNGAGAWATDSTSCHEPTCRIFRSKSKTVLNPQLLCKCAQSAIALKVHAIHNCFKCALNP